MALALINSRAQIINIINGRGRFVVLKGVPMSATASNDATSLARTIAITAG